MTISLVTGVAGFIGSHIADQLLHWGHRVIGIDDFSGGFHDNILGGITLFGGSITDHEFIDEIFQTEKPRYVYHCAAYAAEGLSHFIRRFNYTNNLIGSVNLINAAVRHAVDRFVFLSSIAVYGEGEPPFLEHQSVHPIDPYGIAKYAVELDLAAAERLFGLKYIIFRLHNVYGERQNIGDPYRNVVGIFMNKILQNQPLPIFGDGKQVRAFTHISDVSKVIAESIEEPMARNEIFNLGSDNYVSINELANLVSIAMTGSKDYPREHLPPREEAQRAWCKHTKAKVAFGIEGTTPLEEGLQRTADWVKRHGARSGKPFGNIEVEHNMPPSWRQVIA